MRLKTHKVARWFLLVELGDSRAGCYAVLATESEIRKLRRLKDGDRMFLQGKWVMGTADGLLAIPWGSVRRSLLKRRQAGRITRPVEPERRSAIAKRALSVGLAEAKKQAPQPRPYLL